MNRISRSTILKLCLFATGLSGIVAEYILSTLATYFLGNSTVQWTMILSVMLFAMGLGSRLSRFIDKRLLEAFVTIEFLLSVLVSFSALTTYTLAGYINYLGVMIYGMSILIGLMIGMEIPLVIRLNEEYESLKVNISGVMEKDYYGSLIGGVFFAFVGLPFLGLTYTPFVLGAINFAVALLLFFRLRNLLDKTAQRWLSFSAVFIVVLTTTGLLFSKPIIQFGEQNRYRDKVIYSHQSAYQRIVVTQWKEHYWLYLNGNQQLSTLDEQLYHEPMVHPTMKLASYPKEVLILGGGDGAAAREVLKYATVESILLVDLDSAVTNFCQRFPPFVAMNEGALSHPKTTIKNMDAFTFMEQTDRYFDVIIIDFPDPKSIELGRLFSKEFFEMCHRQLRPYGTIIAQSGSPYYATNAFICIEKTMQAAGFNTLPLHNQVLTLGEWGWVLGSKSLAPVQLKKAARSLSFEDVNTRWINHESMLLITSFGKPVFPVDSASIQVNTIQNPVLPGYYRTGNWDLY